MRRGFGIGAQILIIPILFFSGAPARAQTTGSISGIVMDPSGSVIPDIAIICRNVDTGVQQNATTNMDGLYAFTTLPVGHYELETFRPGFKPYKRTGLAIDVGTKLQIDITLEMGEQSQQVTLGRLIPLKELKPGIAVEVAVSIRFVPHLDGGAHVACRRPLLDHCHLQDRCVAAHEWQCRRRDAEG